MKRLMILTAMLCVIAAMSGCSDKSRESREIETLPNEVGTSADSAEDSQDAAAETTAAATTKKASSGNSSSITETAPQQFEADEDLPSDMIGTWKYTYDDDMDAYYIIDKDHSLISMVDISQVMHTNNDGKLVVGTDKTAAEMKFYTRKKTHLVATSENMIFLDVVPREDADTETMKGDFDLYQSCLFPQVESDSDSEDTKFQSHLIIRFVENKASLVEMGLCYSSEDQLVFLTDKKKMLVNYHFEKDDPDVLILEGGAGEEDVRLTRVSESKKKDSDSSKSDSNSKKS